MLPAGYLSMLLSSRSRVSGARGHVSMALTVMSWKVSAQTEASLLMLGCAKQAQTKTDREGNSAKYRT